MRNPEDVKIACAKRDEAELPQTFGHEATVRASLAFYNTRAEIDAMAAVLRSLSASSARRASEPRKS